MWKHAVEPPLLQAARLRLRNRQMLALERFAAVKPSTNPLLPTASDHTDGVFVESNEKRQQVKNLDAARLRIHKRFQNFQAKFPYTVGTIPSRITAAILKEEQKVSQKNYLEMARQRIHRRFEDKFLGLPGFPSTLKAAIAATADKPSSWGSSKAVIITSPPTKDDDHHRILRVNRCWEELCGYTQDEVVGKSLSILGDFQASTDPMDLATLSRSTAKGKKTALILKKTTKHGRVSQIYLRVVPLYSEDDKQTYPCETDVSKIVAYLGVLEEIRCDVEGQTTVILAD